MSARFRAGTVIAVLGMVLSFALSWILESPAPFVTVAPLSVGGKWAENVTERWGKNGDG